MEEMRSIFETNLLYIYIYIKDVIGKEKKKIHS